MKNLIIKSLLMFSIMFGLQGCYTVLWTPDTKITEQYETTSYYYGYAPDFYDVPWWIDVPIIVQFPTYINSDRSNQGQNDRVGNRGDFRDNDGGRNPGGRSPEIINTPPPTISSPGSSNTSNQPTTGSSSSGSTVRSESSGSSSSGSGNRSSDTRNESGNRNTNSGKR